MPLRQQDIDEMVARWYRAEASGQEVQFLISMKYLKITNRTYGHVAATVKGIKASDRHYKMADTSQRYRIVRFYFEGRRRVCARGLTLQEARERCSGLEASSVTCTEPERRNLTAQHGSWFESYEIEPLREIKSVIAR